MKYAYKGEFFTCIPTVEDLYDLYLKSGGEVMLISGITRGELADVFYEAGSGAILTVKLIDVGPALAVIDANRR